MSPPHADARRVTEPRPSVSLDDTDGWIFDLDGVLTDTATLHEQAWAGVFHELLPSLDMPPEFAADDYRRLVTGEDSLDGIRSVLTERGIALPEGAPNDPPGLESIAAVANYKDARYLELLETRGPRPFASSVGMLQRLRAAGVGTAVISTSPHGAYVLEVAGLISLVDVCVDSETVRAMALVDTSDPILFVEAARRLGVETSRAAMVVKGAPAGVEAGRRRAFGVVVGIDRTIGGADLPRGGPDIVVADVGEIILIGQGPRDSPWWLMYSDVDRTDEGIVETLCTLANGYLGSRCARPWAEDNGTSYPGTYLAGVYNRLQSEVVGELVEVESLINAPNWLPVTFRPADGAWLGADDVVVSSHRVRVDLRCGLMVRHCIVTDGAGRRTALTERRVVSMADPHLVALELSCTPINWSGRLEMRAALDGAVLDDETIEDRLLANRHHELIDQGADDSGRLWLRVRTVQSQITVGMAARCRIADGDQGPPWTDISAPGSPEAWVSVETSAGVRTTLEKVVAIFTSKDRAISEPGLAARQTVAGAVGFDELLALQRAAWEPLWRRAAITVNDEQRSGAVMNLHLFHLLQVASPHITDMDAGLGARGLHGEGYRGHVFWDTLFALPILNLRFPAVSRALVTYRSRRLPATRRAAIEVGHRGAMFPWQSGSDGRDETPAMLFNPRSSRWMPDRSRFERHVGLAVAYEAWQHWQVTGDLEFLAGPCADLIFEITRFFADLASWNTSTRRYHIAGVVGPDEFHDGYPWSPDPGVTDNAYTNAMASWLLWRAGDLIELLTAEHRTQAIERLGVDDAEIARWESISRSLHVPFHDGVISQFAGYERLEPFDLEGYRHRYGNIGRLDLILEAEGDSVRRYQVGKQADVLMLLYLLSAEELRAVLRRMGYPLESETIRTTVEYYAARVTHGSTLSQIVHSWVLARADRQSSWRYFQDALASDVTDSQGGTTREGIHLGAMAGTADILQRCYTGLEIREETLWLHPLLPPQLASLRFSVLFRGNDITIDVDRTPRLTSRTGGRSADRRQRLTKGGTNAVGPYGPGARNMTDPPYR
jgi:trehalose/maltose hydrolase-like predicted phosphorylase/beta-phosphoglucomutase-like phosphatase (HAD superfamily)